VTPLAEALALVRSRLDGTLTVLLMDLDGIVVARASDAAPIADELLAASIAGLLRRADDSARDTDLGPAVELTIASPRGRIVAHRMETPHALVVLLQPDALAGRARHELRLAAERLGPELAA